MNLPIRPLLLLSTACLLCTCRTTEPCAPSPANPPQTGQNETGTITLHGHLICTYMHTFFKADPGTRESLQRQQAPARMFEKEWEEEIDFQEEVLPDPEAYFAFRSTYLPPMRSFIRLPLADTHYEQSYPWDECCPVRVTLHVDPETGKTTCTDFAPADPDFLRKLAADYNQTVKAGPFKGLAGAPTTEAMRGQALPVDAEFDIENPGPLTRRYRKEGEKARLAAEAEYDRVNTAERNQIPHSELTAPDGNHEQEWATFPGSKLGAGHIVRITGTPWRLTATGNTLIFSESQGGSTRELLRLPLNHPGVEKAPLLICTSSQNPPGSFEATILCLSPDGKSLVIVPDYDKSQAPVCISWRHGTPRIELPIAYRCSLTLTGTPTVQKFEGWLGNTPVTMYHPKATSE